MRLLTRIRLLSAAAVLVGAATASAQSPPAPAPVKVQLDDPTRPLPRDPSERTLEPKPGDGMEVVPVSATDVLTAPPFDPPLGFAGPSTVIPRSGSNAEFVTVEDRWRLGFPEWDRYGNSRKWIADSAYRLGRAIDPYNLNVLKGDYPIYGQHTFLNMTATSISLFEGRQIPTATTPFESTARPFQFENFGRPNQFLYSQLFTMSFDLFHGDTAAFKPMDWRVKITPAFNANFIDVDELAVVSPDVRKGTQRGRSWFALQEAFGEIKIADTSPEYDFMSIRAGNQPFSSDFRGFIFSDTNRGVRLFGTRNGNRDQYNLAFFRQLEKETNSGLNTMEDRNQNILIANYYRQDFIFPGYTLQGSVHYNNDGPDTLFDRNRFLVRPDPTGIFQPHRVEVAYLGFAGDGHIDRFNVSHAFYWALGRDSKNPLAGKPQSISAQMAALELSYDRDWARFRVSGLWASGDSNVSNGRATGFDSILDNTVFAGEGSFYNRQNLPLFGVQLVQRNSLFNGLRSSKIQGQTNFVNPGLELINFGFDADITPRFRVVNNANFMWFNKTAVLEQFVYQNKIDRDIGADFSTLFEWRPVLNNNVIILSGASVFVPGGGFRQLYNRQDDSVNPLGSLFMEVVLQY
ncbi:MAG: hypothetical protein JNK93_15300 [Planctomycetia bacterium]|nr:hypothetical protein [Planctomycetia bacterium]